MKPYRKLVPAILLSAMAVATCSAQYEETPAQRLLRERGSILDKESVDQRQQRLEWERYQRERKAAMERQAKRQTYEETIPVEALATPATETKPARSRTSSEVTEQAAKDMAFFGIGMGMLVALVVFGLLLLGMPLFIFIGMLNTRATRKATEALLAEQRFRNSKPVS